MDDVLTRLHGGRLIARRLKAHGVSRLFTLSGGHLFSIYEGCRAEGIEIIDTRHEATAAFAAEGWAKVTREPGVAALTAGPGVTNGMSAMASARQNHSPMIVLGGRAPAFRWGQGSLQEIDHVPFVRPVVKLAATAGATLEIPGLVDEAFSVSLRAHTGPVFLDFPLDIVFMETDVEDLPEVVPPRPAQADGAAVERALALLAEAERPVIMAGTNLYWGHGEDALRELAERRGIPVFLNGLGRGCLPADHALAFARARRTALEEADVALVIGVPMDWRGRRALRRPPVHAVSAGGRRAGHDRLGGEAAGARKREAVSGARRAAGPARAAAPDARLRRARSAARPRRDRDRRRRRLRVLRRPRGRLLPAGLLARSRPVRVPRQWPGVRARGQARPP
jgi:acetolactate synthase-1/2/3 large subunit